MDLEGLLAIAALLLIGFAASLAGYLLMSEPPAAQPCRGNRGLKRRHALDNHILFALTDPVVRYLAGWLSRIPMPARRAHIVRRLQRAGDYLGWTADEYLAAQILAGGAVGAAVLVFTDLAEISAWWAITGLMLGSYLPQSLVKEETKQRSRAIARDLPMGIDLAALCMSAGMDFVGALKQIVNHRPDGKDPLQEEIQRILQELELGATRKQALGEFAERVPLAAVHDFVSAVAQAEDKGSPLAETLQTQASVLRMHRSVQAEEAAARAGVMMMLPLMMLFASIMLILLGPMVINNMNSGL